MLSEILTNAGLTPEQADIYLSLLTHGTQSVGQLTKTTKVQRTYIYKVCQELIIRGLIAQTKKDRGTTFSPLSPDYLLSYSEEQKSKVQQAQAALEGILPTLKDKFSAIEEKPVITYFEGIEGIKKVYMDTIKVGKDIKAILQTSEVDDNIQTWLDKIYIKERLKLKLRAKVIVSSGKWSERYRSKNDEFFRETILVPGDIFPFKHEVDIYGDKIAFINYKKGESLIGIIVDNKQISKTMEALFDLAWIGAEYQNIKSSV
jgi:sugar-specific transcriptional regulator TrmB